MPNQNRVPNAKIIPVAVVYGDITLLTRIKLWFKGVRYAK